jgi:hypothetical protein
MHLIFWHANAVFVVWAVQYGASSSSSARGFVQSAVAPSATAANVPAPAVSKPKGFYRQFLVVSVVGNVVH